MNRCYPTLLMLTKSSASKSSNTLRQVSEGKSFGRGQSATINTFALKNIFISVKTTPKYYESRIHVLKMTWFQLMTKDKVIRLHNYTVATVATS